ncbi:MAG: hypothetical protein QOD91_1531 [Frankiales bacterium]|nr:hypothetical protein [Frankiales bacterium]
MTPEPGLFTPDDVTWRLHADPVMGLAGLRALYLQALHPLAMAGVANHSDFRRDPWGRLMRTAGWIGLTTYGTLAQIEPAAERLRTIHSQVRGTDAETGLPYAADDPALLLWVHCCLVDSFLHTYRRCGGPLAEGEADAYVAEQVRLAPLVGLDEGLVPGSESALASYFDQVRPQLRITGEARRAAAFVLAPPMPLWAQLATPARPAWAGLASLGFALLPRWSKSMYGPGLGGLAALPGADLATTAAARALRTTLLALPADRLEGPHLRAARARLGSAA